MSSVLTEPIKLVILFLTYTKYWCMAYCIIHSIYSLIPSEYVKHDVWKDIYKIRYRIMVNKNYYAYKAALIYA